MIVPSSYRIEYEPHTSPAVVDDNGTRHAPIHFSYSIRRPDGSHLFRAKNHEEARKLVARLSEVKDSSR